MAPFYEWGSTASRLQPLRGGNLFFTTKFPGIPGTHSWKPVDLLCKTIGLLLYDRRIACKWIKGSSYQPSVTFSKQKSDQSLKKSLQPFRMENVCSKSTIKALENIDGICFICLYRCFWTCFSNWLASHGVLRGVFSL